MKNDIDFDELDKAVNSLMGGVKSDQPDDEAPTQKTLTISSTLGPDEKPAYDKLDEVAKKIGSEALVPGSERTVVEDLDTVAATAPTVPSVPAEPVKSQPTVSRPPIGRFMDVVHPSSDMRTVAKPVQPVVPPAVTPAPTPTVQPAPVETTQSDAHAVAKPELAPLTPFLPDAKVEKRPLGGQSISGAVQSPFDAAQPEDQPSDKAELPETTSINSEPVPLSDDTQKIPDATTIQSAKSAESPELQAIESTPVTDVPDHMHESIRSVESVDAEQSVAANATAEGAIYDVNNYHQPLGHPAKRKSGWGVVVIILVIILVSGALGAAAYFMLGYGV